MFFDSTTRSMRNYRSAAFIPPALAGAAFALLFFISVRPVHAQTESVLYSFSLLLASDVAGHR